MNPVEKAALRYVADQGSAHFVQLRLALEGKYPGSVEKARAKAIKEREDKRFIGPVPLWAKHFVKKHGQGRVSSLTFRQSLTKEMSGGHCALYSGRIVVTAGHGKTAEHLLDLKGVVLHEIAHATSMAGHDDEAFWSDFHKFLTAEHLYRAYVLNRPWRTRGLKAAARRARKAAAPSRAPFRASLETHDE